MKIFEIDRTFPNGHKKQFKSVEELLEYFKLNYLIDFQYSYSKQWEGWDAVSFYYFAIVKEDGHDLKYTLTAVMSESSGLVSWKVSVTLTVGIWYDFGKYPMES